LIAGLSMALSACQQSERNAALPGAPVETIEVTASQEAERESPADRPEPPARIEVRTPEHAAEPQPEREPIQPLNLDVPSDILNETADTGFDSDSYSGSYSGSNSGFAGSERTLLPGLFDKKKKPKRSISPELLFDEGEDVSIDTLSGAKVKITIPVN
jgi:hypothetical protein